MLRLGPRVPGTGIITLLEGRVRMVQDEINQVDVRVRLRIRFKGSARETLLHDFIGGTSL